MPRPARLSAALAAALLPLLPAPPAAAQTGGALVLPRGTVELSAAGAYRRFDADGSEDGVAAPLVTPFSPDFFPRLGDTLRSRLGGFFAATDTLPGNAPFALGDDDLAPGTLTPRLAWDARTAPISLRAGLLRGVDLSVTVPVERRGVAVTGLPLLGAAVGINPEPSENTARLAAVDSAYVALGGALFLPLAGSAAGEELQRRYLALAGEDADSLVLPTSALTFAQLQERLVEQGLSPIPFESKKSPWRLGDVEAAARVLLLNTTGATLQPPRGASGVRAAAEVGVRLPTSNLLEADSLVEPVADLGYAGASAALLADVFAGRLQLSAHARYERLREADVRRLVWTPGEPYLPVADTVVVSRRPGDRLSLALAPTFRLTDEIGLVGRWAFARRGAVEYGEGPGDGLGFVGIERAEEWSAHRLGAGLVFSTLAAHEAGRASLPFEASIVVERTVAGDGDGASTVATLRGRLLHRLWNRPRREPPSPPPPPPPAEPEDVDEAEDAEDQPPAPQPPTEEPAPTPTPPPGEPQGPRG